ncbi:CPBP family intramembrane glutamic endopeptidase [Flavobacterium limi]|uniref:CPBP family intramembrane glutamic endopeptidase n=1 Tax=Flavobacterium limi TaxID=2045105 RepID=UPI0013D3D9C0
MKNIQFFLIILVFIFISYIDLHFNLNGYLIISFDLFAIVYLSNINIKQTPPHLINFNFFYYLLFVICFYILYFLCTSLAFASDRLLIYNHLSKYEVVKALLLYPILEEFIFRKYLLINLTATNTKLKSILILSLGFTLIHCFTDSAPLYVFLLSTFLSWIYLKTKNIFISIFLHFVNNFLSITSFNFISFLAKFKGIDFAVILLILVFLIFFTLFKIANDKTNKIL